MALQKFRSLHVYVQDRVLAVRFCLGFSSVLFMLRLQWICYPAGLLGRRKPVKKPSATQGDANSLRLVLISTLRNRPTARSLSYRTPFQSAIEPQTSSKEDILESGLRSSILFTPRLLQSPIERILVTKGPNSKDGRSRKTADNIFKWKDFSQSLFEECHDGADVYLGRQAHRKRASHQGI